MFLYQCIIYCFNGQVDNNGICQTQCSAPLYSALDFASCLFCETTYDQGAYFNRFNNTCLEVCETENVGTVGTWGVYYSVDSYGNKICETYGS